MTTTLVHHKATIAANKLIRRAMDGRDYAVAPIVALVAGVVNGELVTADELSAFVAAWNGRPVPLRHPQDANGPISANSPSVIEGSVVGQVFNMAMDGDRLRGEMWLDVAKCERLGGDALATLQRLERGEVVEVSTAYFCDIEVTAGEFRGQAYTGIQRNLRPDHVALLPDEIGACSVAKGCGAGRFNSISGAAAPCHCQDSIGSQEDGMSEQKQEKVIANDDGQTETPVEPVAAVTAELALPELPAELTELAAALREFGGVGALMDAVKGIKANSDRQKAQIVGRLAANSRCAFSKAELEAMGLDSLVKLEASIAPVGQTYVGRNGANVAANMDGGLRAYKGAKPVDQAQAEVKQ